MYLVLAILIFGVLIAIHEFGHFMAARACGVRVNEFAIGMGPAIWTRQGKETLYALRALPIGGYCAMEGEDAESDDPRAFGNQSRGKRFVILAAGAAMNFLLGFLIVLLLYAPSSGFHAPVITSFFEGCPYEGTFQAGDRFYRIGGERIYFASNVSTYLARGGDDMDVVVVRDGQKLTLRDVHLTPVDYEINGQTVRMYGFNFDRIDSGPGAVLRYSWYQAMDFVRMVRLGLWDLVTGGVGLRDMAGVVGIVDMMNETGKSAETVSAGVKSVLFLGAFIAVNLAVMNLLPIPALDGGRIVFLVLTWLIESVTGRKLDPKYENFVNAAALLLLMGLMVLVMFNDIVRIIRG